MTWDANSPNAAVADRISPSSANASAIRLAPSTLGSFGFICIAILCVHCMKMLVRSAHKVLTSRPDKDFIDYGETAELAFRDAGGRWQKWLMNFIWAIRCASSAGHVGCV